MSDVKIKYFSYCFSLLFSSLQQHHEIQLPMKNLISYILIVATIQLGNVVDAQSISRIAFGSCSHQNLNQPILDSVIAEKPDLFIYLGDNIYGDTRNMRKLQRKYDKLAAKPEFQRLRQSVRVIATWDDHDYGIDDGDGSFPKKKESKEIFLNF